jgi:hypothetical protein
VLRRRARSLNLVVRRQTVRCAVAVGVLGVLGGCHGAGNPVSTAGYESVRNVSGCRTPTAPNGLKNFVPTAEQEAALLSLLTTKDVAVPRCWYADRDDRIELDAGPFCDTKLKAVFRRVEGSWSLVSENTNPFIICDERAR